jgi:hypothetical protein
MIDLVDSHDPDDIDADVQNAEDAGPPDVDRPSTAAIAARVMLDAALTRQARALLKQSPRLIIAKVQNAAWIPVISGTIRRMERAPYVFTVTELRRAGGAYHRVGEEHLHHLQSGQSILYISQDPDGMLHNAVLAAADLSIEVPALTPALLRRIIRQVTGRTARGVTGEMASLDVEVVLSVVRSDLTAGECVKKLRMAVGRRTVSSPSTVPPLTDLPLTDAVRKWSSQMLADLMAAKAGEIGTDTLVYALLEGPPGTGKTLIAESLARTAGWAFVSTTVGSWFTTGDGALGGVAKNIKGFVDAVLAAEPAIGFLDELDAIPNRATMDNRARDWWTPVVNLLLTEIDRLRRSGKCVMLVGATNFYEHLDAALVRPGRLQQRVSVLPPQTEAEVAELLRYYLHNDLTKLNLDKLVRLAIGATPAMVEGWVKEGRSAARAAGRALTASDLLEQMLPPDSRSAEDVRSIALHEIGHAIVAHRLGLEVDRVSIIPDGSSGGHTRTGLPTLVPTWEHVRDLVTVMLGGRAADTVLGNGPNAGAEIDLANATSMLLAAHERQGLRTGLVAMPALGARATELMRAIDVELHQLLERAVAIVEADRMAALKLASRLVEERILISTDIARGLGNRPPRPAREQQPQVSQPPP